MARCRPNGALGKYGKKWRKIGKSLQEHLAVMDFMFIHQGGVSLKQRKWASHSHRIYHLLSLFAGAAVLFILLIWLENMSKTLKKHVRYIRCTEWRRHIYSIKMLKFGSFRSSISTLPMIHFCYYWIQSASLIHDLHVFFQPLLWFITSFHHGNFSRNAIRNRWL